MRIARAVLAVIGIVLVIIACAGVATAVPTHVDSVAVTKINDDGSSSKVVISDAYTVKTPSDWQYIVGHSADYTDKIIVLTDHIVFTEPCGSLGSDSSPFSGTIYGNGYSFKNFTQSGSSAKGLISYVKDVCILNGVCLNNTNIVSTRSFVGGLIGSVDGGGSRVHLTGCQVISSSIGTSDTSTGGLGGLIGYCYGDANVWINASSVDRSELKSVPSSGTAAGCVGGLVGYVNNIASLTVTNSRVNASSLSAQGNSIGGLIGFCSAQNLVNVTNLIGSQVTDCKLSSTSGKYVGGLVGSVDGVQTLNMNGCTFEKCTVSANQNSVGGLIGYTHSATLNFGSTLCRVSESWVDGTSETDAGKRGAIFGYTDSSSWTAAGSAWPQHSAVYRLSSAAQSTGTVAGLDNTYTETGKAAPTSGSTYGSVIDREGWTSGTQYGYNPARLVFRVTVSVVGNGTAYADRAAYTVGETVQLHQTADSGSQFVSWSAVPKVSIVNSQFTMPECNVDITAAFGDTGMRGVTFAGVPTTGAWVYADGNITIPVNVSNYTSGMSAFRMVIDITGASANDPPTYTTTNGGYIDDPLPNYAYDTWSFAYNQTNVTTFDGTANRTVITLFHSGISVYGGLFGYEPFTIGILKIPLENRTNLGNITLHAWMTEAYDEMGNPIDGDTGIIPLGVRPYPQNITYFNDDTGVPLDNITALKEDTPYGNIAAYVYAEDPSMNLFNASFGDTVRWSLIPVENNSNVATIIPNNTNPSMLYGNNTGTAYLATVINFTAPTIVYPAIVQYAHNESRLWQNLTLYNNNTHMVQTGSEIQYAYTLSIPADFSLKQNQVVTKYVNASNFTIPRGEQMNVYISSDHFDSVGNQYRMYYLADSDVHLNYTIETNGTVIRENNRAILVANQTQRDIGVTTQLNFSITETPSMLGVYRDRLTFMVNFTKIANVSETENT